MHGLNEYDFTGRWQDPRIPSFTSIDPLCEMYYSVSPYNYCLNNPIRYIDIDGMQAQDTIYNEIHLSDIQIIGKKRVMEPVSGIWDNLSYFLFGRTYNTPLYVADQNGTFHTTSINLTYNVNRQGYIVGIAPKGGIAPLPSPGPSSIKNIIQLLKAGRSQSKAGLTAMGRALKKHSDRVGSAFPKIVGNQAAINTQGEKN